MSLVSHPRVPALAWLRSALTSPKGLPCACARTLADVYDEIRRAPYTRIQPTSLKYLSRSPLPQPSPVPGRLAASNVLHDSFV